MSIIEIFVFAIFLVSVFIFEYYFLKAVRVVGESLERKVMAAGVTLFIVTSIIGLLLLRLPGIYVREAWISFSIWTTGIVIIVVGGVYTGKAIQKIYPMPMLKFVSVIPSTKYYLVGILVFVFSIPINVIDLLFYPEDLSWFTFTKICMWTFGLGSFAFGARLESLLINRSGVAAPISKEISLLRDDIFIVSAYTNLINTFLATVKPIARAIRKTLLEYFEYNPIFFEGCKLKQDGTIDFEPVVGNIDRIHRENRIQEMCTMFSALSSKLLELYSAVTSPKHAEEVLAKSYNATREAYGNSPLLFDILRSLPKGVLEEERIALLPREELEARVQERTEELLKAKEALRESEEKYRLIFESAKEGISIYEELPDSRKFVECNPQYAVMSGYSLEELIQIGDIQKIQVGHNTPQQEAVNIENSLREQPYRGVFSWIRPDGKENYIEYTAATFNIGDRRFTIGIDHDVTERKQAEDQIAASLEEKEVLLKEIHHRVKNNLQILSSLFYLQARNIKDEKVLEIFMESQDRVKSMSLIHEKLYQSQTLARINFAEYIRSLTTYLFQVHRGSPIAIKLNINTDDVLLNIDTAIPCGLIINELVSNSLKYAFPEDKADSEQSASEGLPSSEAKGEIHIELTRNNNGEFTLIISDTGVGFPEDLDFRNTESLGLQLVIILVKQLEGTIELDRSSGTAFKITFTELK